MAEALRWYLALAVIGACGTPPAALLLGRLPSGGHGYARPLGLLLVTLLTWLVASVTPLPYGTGLTVAALIAVGAVGVVGVVRGGSTRRTPPRAGWRGGVRTYLRADRRQLLAIELVMALVFVLVVLVRAQAPAAAGTEKPMDMLLLQAVHRTRHFPPGDPWFAGAPVSYYYLGHVSVDVTARLARVTSGSAFTLGLAGAAAMAAGAAYTLAGDLATLGSRARQRRATRPIAGSVAVGALLLLSTAEAPLEWLSARGIGRALWARLGVEGLPGAAGTAHGLPVQFWWWWHATRVVPGTITEFPAFSLVLGDLHAHVLALPLAITACALAVQTFGGQGALTWRSWIARPGALPIAAALYAALLMTNSWDVLLYGTLWLVAATAAGCAVGWRPLHAAYGAVRYLLPPAALALLITAPYLRAYTAPALHLRLLTTGATDPVRGALVWLPLAAVCACALLIAPVRVVRRDVARGALGVAGVIVAWAVAVTLGPGAGSLVDRGAGWITIGVLGAVIALAGGAAASAVRDQWRDGARGSAAWLGLIACAAAIMLATELLNVQDALHGRWNTVFKFWYGAWVLLAIAAGAAAGHAWNADQGRGAARGGRAARWRLAGAALCAVVAASALWYAPAMAASRSREGQRRGIDALAFLSRERPGLAATVAWAQTLPVDARLLEAPADPYSDGDLVSAYSGVATWLGWTGHEVQWRGHAAAITERLLIADAIFADGATAETAQAARAYGIQYIVIGPPERRRYGDAVLTRFAAWPVAFEAPGWRVVTVPPTETQS